ncbi:MAG: serine hydrolase domain-containing protein [Bacteroidota bacterium]
MNYLKTIPILLIFSLTSCSEKEPLKTSKINAFINKAMDSVEIVPSLSVAIIDSTGIVMVKGFGRSDIENNIRATEKTNYYIASTTKSFVGFLATILDDENHIMLNSEITSYKPFSEFESKDVFENVTIRDLLSHQSGLDNGFLSFRLAYSGSYTREDILRIIEDYTFLREEGKQFEYTNLGYYLYSVILKEELGSNWQDLIDEKVFTPLQMEIASAYISQSPEKLTAQPYYGTFPDSFKKAGTIKSDETMHAAGGLMMNAEDAAKSLQFYLNKGKLNNYQVYPEEIVKKSYQKEVETDKLSFFYDASGYGLGWLHANYKGHKMVTHLGGYIGYKASITFFPEESLGVAVFTNHQELGRSLGNTVSDYIYELYLGNTNAIEKYGDSLLVALKERLKVVQKRETEGKEEWGVPVWNLSLSNESYTGKFYNDKDGLIIITYKDGKFVVNSGNLTTYGEPNPDLDCFQVELISTSRKSLCFKRENNTITGIDFRDKFFKKID